MTVGSRLGDRAVGRRAFLLRQLRIWDKLRCISIRMAKALRSEASRERLSKSCGEEAGGQKRPTREVLPPLCLSLSPTPRLLSAILWYSL